MTRRNEDPRGSLWRRWDPHIHTPGTVLNDQYNGSDAWERFLTGIETANPRLEAIGVTDYYSVDQYEKVLAYKASGRLTDVGLIFPNIEMRLGVGTGKGAPVNVHLLVSPEDEEHVAKARRFLSALKFEANNETYRCNKSDLIQLGYTHNSTLNDDEAALRSGTNQFKVDLQDLREQLRGSSWAKENILIAVAGGSSDGTSGLQNDSSLATLRQEIEKASQVIFSSSPVQRAFWLGEGSVDLEDLTKRWGGRKVCLHGSDAHQAEAVGAPNLDRYTWIKGDTTFESLRQACIEPTTRAIVGPRSPRGAHPHQTIHSVKIQAAPWCKPPMIPLNPGLVGIIGARGSGKTALADLIAAGGFALGDHQDERSFLRRAAHHLSETAVELTWEQGDPTCAEIGSPETRDSLEGSRVQYLTQQFVENLCSSEGVTNELLSEIERVVYDAHPLEDRIGTTSFQELLEVRASRGRELRRRMEEAIRENGELLSEERSSLAGLEELKKQRTQRTGALEADKAARSTLIIRGGAERAALLESISTAIATRRLQLDSLERRKQSIRGLGDAIDDLVNRRLPAVRTGLQSRFSAAILTDAEWANFTVEFAGDVRSVISAHTQAVDHAIAETHGSAPEVDVDELAKARRHISEGTDLASVSLALLELEASRLRTLIGLDTANLRKLDALATRISQAEIGLAKLNEQIAHVADAPNRIKALIAQRQSDYAAVFDAIVEEEAQLRDLYSPLKKSLEGQLGALGKLSFSVRRLVDIEAWARRGEQLLDLRTAGPFRGHGALLAAARKQLLTAWTSGSSAEVASAMSEFRTAHDHSLLAHSPVSSTDRESYRAWGVEMSSWLTSTDHINVRYSVEYDSVDIAQLSPGTRGIVLLLLYLSIDQNDDRPLIIDQPEENLDPKSVFDELVDRFRATRLRRQVIIVTHNANLIVNADADQVIVASCGHHVPARLPDITYQSGGLENPGIRRQVCEILEGGEAAFRERARRLRVDLQG